jgi:hypothetical protein
MKLQYAGWLLGLVLITVALGVLAQVEAPHPYPEVPASLQTTAAKMTVPAGTRILVRTTDPIDSSKQQAGYRFTGSLETNLQAEDAVVAPRGTPVHGQLTEAKSAGRMSGGANLTLELTDIVIGGTAYPIMTTPYEMRSEGKGKKTTRRILGGTGLGAMIGGIAGGGTGAAIGAVSGAALGTAASAAKGGQQVQVPSESLIEFRLEQPVSLPVER